MLKSVALAYLKKYKCIYVNRWSVRNKLVEISKNKIYGSYWTNSTYNWYWSQGPRIEKEYTFEEDLRIEVTYFKNKFHFRMTMKDTTQFECDRRPKCEFQILVDDLLPEVESAIKYNISCLAAKAVEKEDDAKWLKRLAKAQEKILGELSPKKRSKINEKPSKTEA